MSDRMEYGAAARGAAPKPSVAQGAASRRAAAHDPALWNEDLAPTTADQRSWDWPSIAALWVGMVVCVPTYMIAAGLVSEGGRCPPPAPR